VPSANQRNCELPKCIKENPRFRVNKQAQCVECGDFLIPSEDRKSCVEPVCANTDERILETGKCDKCLFSVPAKNKKSCIIPCKPKKEKVNKDGTCTRCEPNTIAS